MSCWITYGIIAALLLVAELVYFKIADHFNIIDKPNERSSHTKVVLRGGGVIFTVALWIWYIWLMARGEWGMVQSHWPLLAAVTLGAGVSFIDDIHSLPDSVRLVAQFAAMLLLFMAIGMMHWHLWWFVILSLFVCVGATNIYNFMDGINGITGGYSLAVLIPLIVKNEELRVMNGSGFVDTGMLVIVGLSLLVFCWFNFRARGKAKCFAGDVGSIGMAFILLFGIGRLIMQTWDVTWMVLLIVYGMDGCLTIIHRIMLHERLGEAHRKHAYQLMANELGMSHVVVSLLYVCIQLVISLGFIYLCPNTILAHWIYLVLVGLVLAVAYVLFMKKYYHLHEEYLASLEVRSSV